MYSNENLERDIAEREQANAKIRLDRGRRYGSRQDVLQNVRDADPEGAWRGAYTSMVECVNRMRNYFFVRVEDMTNEQIDDIRNAFEDCENYAHYAPILFEQKLAAQEPECHAVPYKIDVPNFNKRKGEK